MLSKYSFSMNCYSEGISGSACAANGLRSVGVLSQDRIAEILQGIGKAKDIVAQEVEAGKNLVTISEVLRPYTVSQTKGILKSSKDFFDDETHLKRINEWLHQEEKVQAYCSEDIEEEEELECAKAGETIEEELKNCAYQENLSLNLCRSPKANEFSKLITTAKVKPPVIRKVHEGVYIFANQAGPAPQWWIRCLYREGEQTVKENDCGYAHNQTPEHLWDIWYVKDSAHADEYKVIMPAGKENLCLTAQDEGQVSLSSCSKSEVSERQKWNWWANSDRDEAWAKAMVRLLDNCLDAKSGNVQLYKCKSKASVDRHNQLWQFGKTPTHH
jgi:hypothetical protein